MGAPAGSVTRGPPRRKPPPRKAEPEEVVEARSIINSKEAIATKVAALRVLFGGLSNKQCHELDRTLRVKDYLRSQDWGSDAEDAERLVDEIEDRIFGHIDKGLP